MRLVPLLSLVMALVGSPAWAQADLLDGLGGPAGFGAGQLIRGDDNVSDPIDLTAAFPNGLNYFGSTYTEVFVNENGNITFSANYSAFRPLPFPSASRPMIAPFWGDVDTCDPIAYTNGQCDGPLDQGIYWHVDDVGKRFVVTWNEVGYFQVGIDKGNSFQIIIQSREDVAAGAFDIEFRYAQLEWTTANQTYTVGDGGTELVHAKAGFDAANFVDFFELPGSFTPAIAALETTSNVDIAGVWRFQVHLSEVAQCGDGVLQTGEQCDLGDVDGNDGCGPDCRNETDTDNDGEYDGYDNCALIVNPLQEDFDNDGVGDFCDNCPTISNYTQANSNDAGQGDACEGVDGGPPITYPDAGIDPTDAGGGVVDDGGGVGPTDAGGGVTDDSGVTPDDGGAVVDSGIPDAGDADAGQIPDGGVGSDAAVIGADVGGGNVADAGDETPPGVTPDCACSAGHTARGAQPGAMALLLLVLFGVRRRGPRPLRGRG